MPARRRAPQPSLFPLKPARGQPLADRMRPAGLDEFVGQEHLLGPGKLLSQMVAAHELHSMILWGPPGSGKTTLAYLLARQSGANFISFSAVICGVAELRDAAEAARNELERNGRSTMLFIDEIHRWNRAQQDACLPHVESGLLTLIGATTENPSFEIIAPLLSRARVLVLNALSEGDIAALIKRALDDPERGLGKLQLKLAEEAMSELIRLANGDARQALNMLEVAAELAHQAGRDLIGPGDVREASQHKPLLYDRAGEEHYNVISAFIKSMRGSDPDAALYWLMRMVEAGEEPLFIARRMVIFAAEDIGNADPRALQLAIAVKEAVDFIGMPEGAIPLAQGVTYLASAPKSNASYRGMLAAREDVKAHGALAVPLHLRNAPTALMREMSYGEGYRYPHDYAGAVVEQKYVPDVLKDRRYYVPGDRGYESRIREFLDWARARKRGGAAALQSERSAIEPSDKKR